ncbi:MAG TPA: glycerol-3-phosphate dehydrogenase/oxidase [Acidimicrobiales bacterium]|jgi:glycerol-3-phosphate dehydrogenase|nr:glycerol-3-phosphate dehydrogenase/oxidase [Acidimicrobiales bacterium]
MIRSLAAAPRTSFEREAALARMAEETFDVLVIGGGITGAGVALDAAARGLRTALVEARDFGSGTSSRSSKLIHGGLRYLQQREFGLVYEALAERQRLLENAPHLVTPLPFLIPILGKGGIASSSLARLYSIALWEYDLTGGLRIGRRHRRVTAAGARKYLPSLDVERLVAAFLYWDAHTDDARLTLTVLRTAVVNYGAVAANYAPVSALLTDDGPSFTTDHGAGRVVGARLEDGTEIRADVVVNATGVWSDVVRAMDEGPEAADTIRPAKGIHLTFRATRLPATAAAVLPVPGDRRSIFVIPWGRFTYAGTTDTDYDGPLDDPQCTPADVAYVLAALNSSVDGALAPSDVVSSWAGLRPLVRSAKSERTADLSRRHRVTRSRRGMVTVTGGKLTTYRAMASDTMDVVVEELGRGARRCPTKHLMLLGGNGSLELRQPEAARRLGVTPDTLEHLTGRYGTEARTVIAIMEADPELARPLLPGLPYLRAEVVYAARYEMAWTLEDVLARRTRAQLLDRDVTEAGATSVARLLAPELGWSARRIEREASGYHDAMSRARAAAGLRGSGELARHPN